MTATPGEHDEPGDQPNAVPNGPPAMSPWKEATIDAVQLQTPRIMSIFLRAPIDREVIRHVAGQHLDVKLTAPDGYAAQRSYSIASAPGDARIELLIEKLDDGEVSPYFHDIAQAGDTIEVRGPLGGHFIWRPADGGPLLLLAGGSGIAPLLAMVRDWARTATALPLCLIASARTWEDFPWRDELLALEAQHAAFRFIAVTTRGPRRRDADIDRRIDADALRTLLSAWGVAARQAYVCGSNRFVEAAVGGLLAVGVPAAIVRTERYGGA